MKIYKESLILNLVQRQLALSITEKRIILSLIRGVISSRGNLQVLSTNCWFQIQCRCHTLPIIFLLRPLPFVIKSKCLCFNQISQLLFHNNEMWIMSESGVATFFWSTFECYSREMYSYITTLFLFVYYEMANVINANKLIVILGEKI